MIFIVVLLGVIYLIGVVIILIQKEKPQEETIDTRDIDVIVRDQLIDSLKQQNKQLLSELSQLRGRGFILGENFPDIEALQFENGSLQNEINSNQKEIRSLRMCLQSHGEVIEQNSRLRTKLSSAECEIRRQTVELTNKSIKEFNDDRDMKIGILKMINEMNVEKSNKLTVLLAVMMVKLKQLNGDKVCLK